MKKKEEMREALARATMEASETHGRHHARMSNLSRMLWQRETAVKEDLVRMANLVDKVARQRETSDRLSRQVKYPGVSWVHRDEGWGAGVVAGRERLRLRVQTPVLL